VRIADLPPEIQDKVYRPSVDDPGTVPHTKTITFTGNRKFGEGNVAVEEVEATEQSAEEPIVIQLERESED
jgi:hypothetical protein